jgi:regulator of protease activity HflC (stomatin/prohibitin superfamily)
MSFYEENRDLKVGKIIFTTLSIFAVLLLIFSVFVPLAKPWWAEQTGKAELAQAEQNRQIAVKEAQAKLDSSKLLAQAEVERANGVAQANKIIGESLKENEDYLRYLWITDVAGANIDKTVVYIPTEANLPILEATRDK